MPGDGELFAVGDMAHFLIDQANDGLERELLGGVVLHCFMISWGAGCPLVSEQLIVYSGCVLAVKR